MFYGAKVTIILLNCKTKALLFFRVFPKILWGFAHFFSYIELRSKVLSLDNKNKNTFLFCIVLAYSYLCREIIQARQ